MAANDGDPAHRVSDLFGFALPAGTGAPGSPPAAEAQAMPDSAFHPQLTMPYESVQNRPVPTGNVGLDDTAMPGQTSEGISGVTETGTGAGGGNANPYAHPNAGGGGTS